MKAWALFALCMATLAAISMLWYLLRRDPPITARYPLPPEDDDGVQPADPRLIVYRDTWNHPLPDDITYRILPRRSDA